MFSELSKDITKSLDRKEKKTYGIFFTPKKIRQTLIEEVFKYIKEVKEVLEPSVGGCDFVQTIESKFGKTNITAVEKNINVYNKIKKKFPFVINEDFITKKFYKKFDLILGNPPYFLINKKLKDYYLNFFDKGDHWILKGKVNIFCLFIFKCLNLLKENGILSFVIPVSILNTYSYNSLRKYISDNYKIVSIIPLKEQFVETKQETLILTIKNTTNNNDKFLFKHFDNTVFTYEKDYYTYFVKNKIFLRDLDVSVKTGSITWNQHKEKLEKEKTNETTLLIYDFNIKNGKLQISEEGQYNKKGQYIKLTDKSIKGPALLLTRGNGNSDLKLKSVKLDENIQSFYAENHIYVIKAENKILDRIHKSLKRKDLIEFLIKNVPNKCLTKRDIINLIYI